MSAEKVSSTRVIYVHLLNEGTTVMRPTRGIALGRDVYRLLPTKDYDPVDEHWQFPPGSVVRCIRDKKEGQEIWVAHELITGNSWNSRDRDRDRDRENRRRPK